MIDKFKIVQKLSDEGRLHLKTQLAIAVMFLILVASVCLVVYDVVTTNLSWYAPIAIAIPSFAIGILMVRHYRVKIEERQMNMIGRMDKTGAIVILIYVLFRLGSITFFEEDFQDLASGLALTLAGFAGISAGRLLGTVHILAKAHKANKARKK